MAGFFRPIEHAATEVVSHTSLRGIAALCVLFYHAQRMFAEVAIPGLSAFVRHGYLFVDLFFVLSGYVICLNYDRWFAGGVRAAAIRVFMARRLARLYPNFLVWFLIPMALSIVQDLRAGTFAPFGPSEWYSFLLHLLMLQSILDAPVRWNIPLWSISVEMVSYATFPLLALLLARRPGPVRPVVALTGLAIWAAICLGGTVDVISGPVSVLRGFAGFWLGVTLGSLRDRPVPLATPALSVAQGGCLLAVVLAVGAGAEPVALALFVALVYLTRENRGLAYAVARCSAVHRLGEISFSVYVAHTTVLGVIFVIWYKLRHQVAAPMEGLLVLFLVGTLLTVAVAHVSYRYLEVPSNRFLRRRIAAAVA